MRQWQEAPSCSITKEALMTAPSIPVHFLTPLTSQVEVNSNKSLNHQDCHHCRISICTSKVTTSSLILIDFLKKVNSDYPYPPTGRRGRSSH
jgi:hypothetical protein